VGTLEYLAEGEASKGRESHERCKLEITAYQGSPGENHQEGNQTLKMESGWVRNPIGMQIGDIGRR
jgi:hypothetical protein